MMQTQQLLVRSTSPSAKSSSQLQRKCACGGTPGATGECEACGEKRLQRKTAQPSDLSSLQSEAPPIVHEVLRSPGQPLDRETRAFMEPRFGHDFSNVRVHTDARAVESARAVDAAAYTVGRNVVFDTDQYAPGSSVGRRLIAHELAHSIQQGSHMGGFSESDSLACEDSTQLEREAVQAAEHVNTDTKPLDVQSSDVHALQRQSAATGDPKKKQVNKEKTYGPYTLPELTITPTGSRSTPTTPRGPEPSMTSVRDVSFVKVETVQELNQRVQALNREAEKELQEKFLHSQGTFKDAGPGVDARAKEILKQQFGDGWGTFFWWTRGGGQTGEGSQLWSVLEIISGFNRAVPVPRPGGDPVFRDRLPAAYSTEATK